MILKRAKDRVEFYDYYCRSCRLGFADQDDFNDKSSGTPLEGGVLPKGSPCPWVSCPRCGLTLVQLGGEV